MKVEVTSRCKGAFYLNCIDASIDVGKTVVLSEEDFFDSHTQSAIQSGFLRVIDGPKSSKSSGKEFVNNTRYSLTLTSINRSVASGARFFVKQDLVDSPDILSALNKGMIAEVGKSSPSVEDDKSETKTADSASESKSTKKKSTSKKKSTKNASKKKTSKKIEETKESKSKTIKRVNRAESSNDSSEESESDSQKTKVETPTGMYAHDPNNEGVSVRIANRQNNEQGKVSDIINRTDPIFIDGDEGDDVDFVDHEQTKERARKNGIDLKGDFENNSEVN